MDPFCLIFIWSSIYSLLSIEAITAIEWIIIVHVRFRVPQDWLIMNYHCKKTILLAKLEHLGSDFTHGYSPQYRNGKIAWRQPSKKVSDQVSDQSNPFLFCLVFLGLGKACLEWQGESWVEARNKCLNLWIPSGDPQENTRSSADLHQSQGVRTARTAVPHFRAQLKRFLIRSIPSNFSFPSTLRFILPVLLRKKFLLPVDGEAVTCLATSRFCPWCSRSLLSE